MANKDGSSSALSTTVRAFHPPSITTTRYKIEHGKVGITGRMGRTPRKTNTRKTNLMRSQYTSEAGGEARYMSEGGAGGDNRDMGQAVEERIRGREENA